ncbi:MAG: hypothetical protein LBD10_01615 [Desulfobulbus sp.]|jgi:hypothetical protein|uniref:hypothetical protein n=1 Tax=Desulfobulbus sp. TaxID=895 RepID=UPI00284EF878|nr:hypothetical protein [Desulfobulbus sp.]MDR2548894.1 hypothetical protein [Desulfobulbus sp.]
MGPVPGFKKFEAGTTREDTAYILLILRKNKAEMANRGRTETTGGEKQGRIVAAGIPQWGDGDASAASDRQPTL